MIKFNTGLITIKYIVNEMRGFLMCSSERLPDNRFRLSVRRYETQTCWFITAWRAIGNLVLVTCCLMLWFAWLQVECTINISIFNVKRAFYRELNVFVGHNKHNQTNPFFQFFFYIIYTIFSILHYFLLIFHTFLSKF